MFHGRTLVLPFPKILFFSFWQSMACAATPSSSKVQNNQKIIIKKHRVTGNTDASRSPFLVDYVMSLLFQILTKSVTGLLLSISHLWISWLHSAVLFILDVKRSFNFLYLFIIYCHFILAFPSFGRGMKTQLLSSSLLLITWPTLHLLL